jgi:Protein of unknown function (DUF559)
MEIKTISEPSAALDRHQSRRDSGLPTVSVLLGPLGLAQREGRLWAERRGRSVVEVADHRLDAIANTWADHLAASGDLRCLVVRRLARRLGEDADEMGGRIARMSPPELDLFLESALLDRAHDIDAACRWMLQEKAGGKDITAPGLAGRLGAALSGLASVETFERAMVALGALIPPGSGPVILAAPRPDGVDAIARSLARLVLSQPRLTAILATDPIGLEDYLQRVPESREKALIRSGIVEVLGLDGNEIGPRQAASEPDALIVDDRARSEAERFLFERLESLPPTAGLFELNSNLDIPFGPGRAMEVDLASHVLQLAIEIDGHYHFQGEDAYRRDRRKDFLLQSRGYLVVRILADDVVRRLEDVLDLILEAVELRRLDGYASNLDPSP